jgi:hypothetical protein
LNFQGKNKRIEKQRCIKPNEGVSEAIRVDSKKGIEASYDRREKHAIEQ